MGPQSAGTISKHMMTQNGTPECKNHIKAYDNISKYITTQNGTPEYKNHIRTYDDIQWDPRVKEPYQYI